MNVRDLIEELQKKHDEYAEVPVTAWDGVDLYDIHAVGSDVYTEAVELQLVRYNT